MIFNDKKKRYSTIENEISIVVKKHLIDEIDEKRVENETKNFVDRDRKMTNRFIDRKIENNFINRKIKNVFVD